MLVIGVFFGTQALTGNQDTEAGREPGANGNITPGSDNSTGNPDDGSTDSSAVAGGRPTTIDPSTLPDGNSKPVEGGITTKILEPPHHAELIRRVASYLAAKNVNQLAAARIEAYMVAAYHDVKRPGDQPGVISQASPGTATQEAVHAAAWVAAQIADMPEMTADITDWVEQPAGKTLQVVNEVLARAGADGYAEAAKATPKTFTGDLGWVPRSTTYPNGLEPGWGALKPILGTTCTVGPPDRKSISAERNAAVSAAKAAKLDNQEIRLVTFTTGTLNPVLGFAVTYGSYLGVQFDAIDDKYEHQLTIGMIGAYDALISTWGAKWREGVTAPVDLAGQDVQFATVAPSYPSWPAVYAQYTESLIRGIDDPKFRHADQKITDLLGSLQQALNVSGDRIFNWSTDIAAGRSIGECHAKAAAATYRAQG